MSCPLAGGGLNGFIYVVLFDFLPGNIHMKTLLQWYDTHLEKNAYRKLKGRGRASLTPAGIILRLAPFILLVLVPVGFLSLSSWEKTVELTPPPDPEKNEKSIRMRPLPEKTEIRDGVLYHICRGGESPRSLTRDYYSLSGLFLTEDLEAAFRREIQEGCSRGTRIRVPDALQGIVENQPMGLGPEIPIKAVYIRGDLALPGRVKEEVNRLQEARANAVVFDVKDIIGVVNYRSTAPRVEEYRTHPPRIPDLPKLIRYLHSRRVYVIARMALFQDALLARVRPDLAIKDAFSSDPQKRLLVKGHPLWVDPALPDVQNYNLGLVQEMVDLGVDEIQFDYVRYPAEGNLQGVHYTRVVDPEDKVRHLIEFLSQARKISGNSGTRLSIDVFGVVAWGEKKDVNTTGQDLARFAPFVDVISPMLYPSHFQRGFEGIPNPADEGRYFYRVGSQKVRDMVGNDTVLVRPWIQAFGWRVSHYNEDYILDQLKGAREGGARGWLMWNAASSYSTVYRALERNPSPSVDAGGDPGNRY